MNLDEFIDAGHFEEFFDEAVGAGNAELGAFFVDAAVGDDEDADAGGVDHGEMGDIEDDFAGGGEEVVEGEFDVAGIVAHDEAAGEGEDVDVGRELGTGEGEDHWWECTPGRAG